MKSDIAEGFYWVKKHPAYGWAIACIGKHSVGGTYWIHFMWQHQDDPSYLNDYPDIVIGEKITEPK